MAASSTGTMLSLPTLKKGYLQKQNRTGLIRNWKQRYITLELGVIKYFEKISHVNLPPYGEGLKGSLNLKNVSVIDKSVDGKCRILINSMNQDEDDLLVECENQKEHMEWLAAINYHTKYAKAPDKSIFTSNNSNEKREAIPTATFTTGVKKEGNFMSKLFSSIDEPVIEKATKWVEPEPVCVIKCLHEITRDKFFINLCQHECIPLTNAIKGSAKWPHMVSGDIREIVDATPEGGEDSSSKIKAIDVIFNPEIARIMLRDPSAKDDVCQKVIRHVRKYRHEQLNEQYKLPKITRRYKGETQEFLNDISLGNSDTKHVQTRNKSGSGEQSIPKAPGRLSNEKAVTGFDSSNIIISSNETSDTTTPAGLDGINTAYQVALKSIPYEIVAANGVMGKVNPDKNAQGRVIACGEKVQIVARAILGGVIWLRTVDGLFIPERFQGGGGNRLLKPISSLQPEGVQVMNANLVEEKIQEFSLLNFFRRKEATFTTAFIIRIEFPNNCFLKISRTIKDLQKLRKDILKVASTQLKSRLTDMSGAMVYIRDLMDGNEDILEDANNMLYCIDSVEIFLNAIISNLYPANQKVNIGRRNASPQFLAQATALQQFLNPRDVDIAIMDVDLLMANI